MVVLVLFVPSLLYVLLNFYLAGMTDLGLADSNTRVQSPGGPVVLIVFSGFAFLVYCWRLRRRQRRLQRALQNLDLEHLTKDGKVRLFLYLRSFRLGRSTLLRRLIPYAYGDQSLFAAAAGREGFNFEEDVSNAIVPFGLLVAIGDRDNSYGAGKIIVDDEKWKDHFHWLATHSWMIFVQPDLTPSVRWEVGQLVAKLSYLRKTVFFMPHSGGDNWDENSGRPATGYQRGPAPLSCRWRHVPSAPRH